MTAITVGTNSYILQADAILYFADRLYSTAFTDAVSTDQVKALLMAAKQIDQMRINGIKAVDTQALEFPRARYSYNYGDQRLNIVGAGTYIRGEDWVIETEVSQAVKDAQCEQAIYLLKQGANGQRRQELQAQGVKSFSLGNLSESYTVGRRDNICIMVKELLAKYLGPAVIV